MDFYVDAAVKGIPLVFVVLGLVQWTEKMGLKGKLQLGASMGIGLLLGVGYQASLAIPGDFASWFAVIVYGLGLGVVASGIYEIAKKLSKHNPSDVQ
jgi:hypothetical protein